jgi:hypothetical protein
MTISSKNARKACAQLTQAHHLLVEAAGLLGGDPRDDGLWEAVLIVLDAREIAGLLVDPDPKVVQSDSPMFWT